MTSLIMLIVAIIFTIMSPFLGFWLNAALFVGVWVGGMWLLNIVIVGLFLAVAAIFGGH